jgi:hypothetical protein
MNGFLGDYINVIPSAAAVINGFIAVLVAQFFKNRAEAKTTLVVLAGIVSAVAIVATFDSQYQIVATRNADIQHRKEIRDQLGLFVAEGLKLMNDCADKSAPPRWADTNKWATQIHNFLDSKMGHSYSVRLGNPAGMPLNEACRNADGPHNDLYRVQYAINFRLDEFSKELGF